MDSIELANHLKATVKNLNFALELNKKIIGVLRGKDKEKAWEELRNYINGYSLESSSEYEGICSRSGIIITTGFPLYELKDKDGKILEPPQDIPCIPPCWDSTFYLDSTQVNLEDFVDFCVRVHGTWDWRMVPIGLPISHLLYFNVEQIEKISVQ